MTTNAPQIPVKIITAPWFSISASGDGPSKQNNYEISRLWLRSKMDRWFCSRQAWRQMNESTESTLENIWPRNPFKKLNEAPGLTLPTATC